MSSLAFSLFSLYFGILLLFALNNTFPIRWPPFLLPTLNLPTAIITLATLSIPFLVVLFQTNNEQQIDPPPTPDLAELLVMWHHPIWAFRRLKAKFYRFSSQFQTLVKHTPRSIRTMEIQIHELQTLIQTMAVRQAKMLEKVNIWQINWDVINELCASADATNQWLEQQLQSLHQEAWDDDHINWDDLEWKEDKYCGQVYHYAITGPDHAHCFIGISRENQKCFANLKHQLARLIFEGQALAFTMSGV
ncbi:hypothetical protein AMATHDRAFT_8517 [Amanita thiersii Skay4041]|uniref:Uncharacterized protein n=1 Tax=Amanita thiersii Skay4041 TaxID=703135 RepID=A0A2A9N7A8_9AGAR|nr:hypothetical protein AMATHDRAFT_8517 [Amanita thiersii Skay4041]